MPSDAFPAVLAYRRGELISNLVHFVDELEPGSEITIPTVESFLIKYVPPSLTRLELICPESVFCQAMRLKVMILLNCDFPMISCIPYYTNLFACYFSSVFFSMDKDTFR